MCSAPAILVEARRTGLRLWRDGDRIALAPARRCSPELLAALRAHKQRVLDLLEAEATHLTPDCAPWLHIARQILADEFEGVDRSTRKSLLIGLRSIRHPLCQQALAYLKIQEGKNGLIEP